MQPAWDNYPHYCNWLYNNLLEKANLNSSKWFTFFNKKDILQELNKLDKEKRKIEVSRLVNAKKKISWRNSKAKEILLQHLISGTIPIDSREMKPDDVYQFDPEFKKISI